MRKYIAFLLIIALSLGFAACAGTAKDPTATESGTVADGALQAPQDPSVIATAVTGETVVHIKDIEEISDVVDPSGNTSITFWQDVSETKPIRVPYSCSIDFNGKTFATSSNAGNGLEIAAVGEENAVTTVKNGTMTQYGIGIRLDAGAIAVENMTIQCEGGVPIALNELNDVYKPDNCVKNSTLVSGAACIMFYRNAADYTKTGITVEESTLVSYDPAGAGLFTMMGSNTNPGVITFGKNVNLYSYSSELASDETFYYSGEYAYLNDDVSSVKIGEVTYDDLTCWSTNSDKDPLNVLMIGNSFCYYFTQELYGIAHAADIDLNITNLYKSGCILEEHWLWLNNKMEGKDKYSYWVTNDMGRWRPERLRTSYEALAYKEWDVITLQQHFSPERSATYEIAKESCTPYAKDYFDYLKKEYPNAKLYWQETWAYQVGHSEIPSKSAQTNQQNNIIRVSEEICKENSVDMVPTGDAWVIARNNPAVGDTLCRSDLYHDGDVAGGQYLNACVWFEILTGKSCVGNTWRPDYALSEEKIQQLQLAAHQAVANRYGEDYAK